MSSHAGSLTHLTTSLYRQQAPTWAVDGAAGAGADAGALRKGVGANPRFARSPRPHRSTAKRCGDSPRSRINLQIVPYLCLHQRLLDGLMAGGFFLVRTHPADVAPASLLRFLDQHDPLAAARAAQLADLIEQCRPCLCTTGAEDVVAMVRAWEAAGQLTVADGPLPMLNEVAFGDALQLADPRGGTIVLPRYVNRSLRLSDAASARSATTREFAGSPCGSAN